MKTAFYIARRYLFAKKSHNVINVISAISAAGMAIGTAAIIIIMSVYNGFDKMIKDNISDLDPDVLLCREDGNFFVPDEATLEMLENDPRIRSFNCILQDNVFFRYGENQGVVRTRGVDFGYELQTAVKDHIVEGKFSLYDGDIPQACIGASLAYSNGIHPRFLEKLELFYPDSQKSISMLNPMSSLNTETVWPAGLISVSADMDQNLLIIPLGVMQDLVGNDALLSAVEIRLTDQRDRSVRSFLKNSGIEGEYVLKDRYHQNPALFKMMKYEKFAIFLILFFIIVIIAFNIFGSMSMLIIEKKEDISSLQAMGADRKMINRLFIIEGWMISMIGMIAGAIVGLCICLLQQTFGFVSMPGSMLSEPYPVVLHAGDILTSCAGVAIIGLVVALTAVIRQSPGTSQR